MTEELLALGLDGGDFLELEAHLADDVAGTSWEKADDLEKDGGDGRGEGHIKHQQRENPILKRRQDDDRLTKRAGALD